MNKDSNKNRFKIIRQLRIDDDLQFEKVIETYLVAGWEVIGATTEDQQYGNNTAVVFLRK